MSSRKSVSILTTSINDNTIDDGERSFRADAGNDDHNKDFLNESNVKEDEPIIDEEEEEEPGLNWGYSPLEDKVSEAELNEMKLGILEGVVQNLNGTLWENHYELERLHLLTTKQERQLKQGQRRYDSLVQSHAEQLAAQQQEWKEERDKLVKEQELTKTTLERRLLKQARLDQDELQQGLRKETKEWRQEKEAQWQESLEIASAAVTAAETREQALQTKLEDLETRYHTEAAQYKEELDQLQLEWKRENKKLVKDCHRLSNELSDARRTFTKQMTTEREQHASKVQHLEVELKEAREQIQFQRLQFSTQQQVSLEQWQEQRDKERKFYAEAMRLLQQERPSFWKRLFRAIMGGRTSSKSNDDNTTNAVPGTSGLAP